MLHNNFHHTKRGYRGRRLLAWVCLAFSLLIIIGVITYSFQSGIFHIPGTGHGSTQGSLPGFIQGNDSPCASTHAPGDSTIWISSRGIKRDFVIHLPQGYGQQPLPLVINYHGYDNSATTYESYTAMNGEADRGNFIVVFPQGALDNNTPEPKPSWNAGIGAGGPTGLTDDVQFTRDILSYIKKNYCLDTGRVYVTGYSIGGSMAYRIACEMSGQIAALATVEGAFYHIPPNGCQATHPVPVLEIHSLADQFAPYDGAPDRKLISVSTFLNLWLSIDQCNPNSTRTIFQKADVTGITWSHCARGVSVEHYKISDGGHVWAGSATPMPGLGYTTHTIDANTVIWNFFRTFKTA